MSTVTYTSKLCSLLKRKINVSHTQVRTGYYILLPEVDYEAAEKLPSLQDDLPTFKDITPDKLEIAIGKKLLDLECTTRNIERDLEDSPKLLNDLFEDVLHPIERATVALNKVFGIAKTLYLTDIKKMPVSAFYGLNSRSQVARNTKFNSINIYNACKAYDKSKLTEEQLRLLDVYITEGFVNGFECNERHRNLIEYKNWLLMQEQTHFRIRVEAARDQFFLKFADKVLAQEFPDDVLKLMADNKKDFTKGPWTVKLNQGLGLKFLEYCSDRDLRWTVWHAEDKAASNIEEDRDLANSVCLEKIRFFRNEKANYIGLRHHMDVSLQNKMARSMEEIDSVMSTYLKSAKPAQLQEILTVQEYADENGCQHPVQLWDLPYWSRKHKKKLFNYDEEVLKNYFPLYRVMNGLFSLCNRLFGVKIQESTDVDVWHGDVKFFYVYEPNNDSPVGGFYFDPYVRLNKMVYDESGIDVVPVRHSCRTYKPVKPLNAFIMNFRKPEQGLPSLLSFRDVRNLFSLFGYNLMFLLSKTTYSVLSGPCGVELDAQAVCSKFMINWLYDKRTFDSIHCHYETGEQLKDLDLIGLKNYLAGYNLCSELYKAKMDIRMHSEPDKFWMDMVEEIWDDYFVFPLSNYHSDPCRYVDMFAENMGGSYYSVIWSEMLAADVFNAFFEPNADQASVGGRFRDTYLTFGGSCNAREVFRRFRGRDPCPEAYLKNLGLNESKTVSSDNPEVDTTVGVAV